jgi:site-specific recombinase XerD
MATKELMREELPKLPYGQGSFAYTDTGKIVYRKKIDLPDGRKVRKNVTCDTVRECMSSMTKIEKELIKQNKVEKNELLCDAMIKWLEIVKKPTLKAQSYVRLESTIRNQIFNSPIGHIRYNTVTSEEIQSLINELNEKNYSHSSIKKTYDCLNNFYRYVSAKDKIDNPMLLVEMPITDYIKAETKTIEFFEQDDIDKFIKECSAKYNTGTLKYRSGYAIASNIYMGMRIGELLALQWRDIDFNNNTVYVCKTLIQINNPDYDNSNKELMKEKDIKKVKFIVQNSTKKSKNRYVPINSKAKELLLLQKEYSEYTEPDDYVVNTRNRKTTTIKNVSDTIKAIEKAAETKVQAPGTHILRHTCASLYFRKGVGIETICQILGNTREVCEKTYVHFIEEQLKTAASKIDVIEI